MLVLGWTPQHVAGVEFELGTAFNLGPADPLGYDERLAERVTVPGRSRSGLEVHDRSGHPGRRGPLKLACDRGLSGEELLGTVDDREIGLAGNFHGCRSFVRLVRRDAHVPPVDRRS